MRWSVRACEMTFRWVSAPFMGVGLDGLPQDEARDILEVFAQSPIDPTVWRLKGPLSPPADVATYGGHFLAGDSNMLRVLGAGRGVRAAGYVQSGACTIRSALASYPVPEHYDLDRNS